MKKLIRKIFIITFGVFLLSIGIYYLWTPNGISPGGISGMVTILGAFIPSLEISQAITIVNLVLIIFGLIFIGRSFAGFTIYSGMLLSVFTIIFDKVYPISEPLVDSLLLNAIFGAVLVGLGCGIVFSQDASTAGSDIIAKIITKFTSLTMTESLLVADGIITVLAISQVGLEVGMYSLIALATCNSFINRTTEGFLRKIEMKIISSKNEEINIYLNKEIGRGTTIIPVTGGFSNAQRKMIYTVLGRSDYIKVKEYINRIDPSAFVIINTANEVVGEGFTYEQLL